MPHSLRLYKREKLCSRTDVNNLFAVGRSAIAYPLRVVYAVKTVSEGEDTSRGSDATGYSGSLPRDVVWLKMLIFRNEGWAKVPLTLNRSWRYPAKIPRLNSTESKRHPS